MVVLAEPMTRSIALPQLVGDAMASIVAPRPLNVRLDRPLIRSWPSTR
jgi:hypothetical protein